MADLTLDGIDGLLSKDEIQLQLRKERKKMFGVNNPEQRVDQKSASHLKKEEGEWKEKKE